MARDGGHQGGLTRRVAAGAAGTAAVASGVLWAPLAPAPVGAAAPDPTPNVLVMMVDDMGWGDSPAHNPGSRIPMPNVERLAAGGMTLTRAYTTPKCAPTRYNLLTGNFTARGRRPEGTWNYRGGGGSQILPGQQTVGNILDRHGYDNGFVGKLHMGGNFFQRGTNQLAPWDGPEDQIDFERGMFQGPRSYGFDYSYLLLRGIQESPYAYFENDRLVGEQDTMVQWPAGEFGDSEVLVPGIGVPDWDSTGTGERLTRSALDFIDRHHDRNVARGTDDPFFLYFAPPAPHDPVTPPADMLGVPIRGATGLGPRADMVYQNDVSLGLLLDALDDRGLTEDTLVLFLSDNGGVRPDPAELDAGHDKHGGLRGHKGEIWEGGARTPLVAMWGDGTPAGSVIPPGSTSSQLVAVHDLAATLAAVVGENLPTDQARESHDILPVLTGSQPPGVPVRAWYVNVAREVAGLPAPPRWSITDGRWKLVLDEADAPAGLHDLTADPAEATNRVAEPAQAGRVQRMRDRLLALRAAERTAPAMALPTPLGPSAGPPFTPATDAGVFLWQDTASGPLRLRANGAGSTARFDVTVLATEPFAAVTPVDVEAGDTVAVDGNTVRFTANASRWWDGLDLALPAGADLAVQVSRDGVPAPGLLRLGPTAAPVAATPGWCPAPRSPRRPRSGSGATSGASSGGCRPARRPCASAATASPTGWGRLIASRPVTVTALDVEADDAFAPGARSASLSGTVGSWWDGFDVQAPAGTTFALHVDEQGQELVHQLNPGAGSLGLPNARWIRR